jgi:hypothetical protein
MMEGNSEAVNLVFVACNATLRITTSNPMTVYKHTTLDFTFNNRNFMLYVCLDCHVSQIVHFCKIIIFLHLSGAWSSFPNSNDVNCYELEFIFPEGDVRKLRLWIYYDNSTMDTLWYKGSIALIHLYQRFPTEGPWAACGP